MRVHNLITMIALVVSTYAQTSNNETPTMFVPVINYNTTTIPPMDNAGLGIAGVFIPETVFIFVIVGVSILVALIVFCRCMCHRRYE